MINKDDLPEYVQDIIDKAMEDGADVDVIKINREGNSRKIFSTDKKQETLDAIDDIERNLEHVSTSDLLDRLSNNFKKIKDTGISEKGMLDLVNKLYMQIIDSLPTPPVRAISIMLSNDNGKASICGYKFKNKQDAANLLRSIADELSDGSVKESRW